MRPSGDFSCECHRARPNLACRGQAALLTLFIAAMWLQAGGCADELPESKYVGKSVAPDARMVEDSRKWIARHREHLTSLAPTLARTISRAECDAALQCLEDPRDCADRAPIVFHAIVMPIGQGPELCLDTLAFSLEREVSELRVQCQLSQGVAASVRQARNLTEKTEFTVGGFGPHVTAHGAREFEEAARAAHWEITVPFGEPVPLPLDALDRCCATVVDRAGRVGNCVPIAYIPIGASPVPPAPEGNEPAAPPPSAPGGS